MTDYDLYFLIKLIAIFQLLKFLLNDYIRKPSSKTIAGFPTVLGRRLTSWTLLLREPNAIRKAYEKAAGKIFLIPTSTNYKVCVSDPALIRDFTNAPRQQLSFEAFIDESLSPTHIGILPMHPVNLHDSKITALAIKATMRNNLPRLRGSLQEIIATSFDQEIDPFLNEDRWKTIGPYDLIKKLTCKMHCFTALGNKLTSDPCVVEEAFRYTRDATITSQIIQFTPWMLQKAIASAFMKWSGAYGKLHENISHEVRGRMAREDRAGTAPSEKLDAIDWTLESTRKFQKPTVDEITCRVMGFLFAGAHQIPPFVIFAIYNLCRYREYLEPLQDEISTMADDDVCGASNNDTPLLDSFLKETARLQPLQSVTMNRKVLRPFDFTDGTHIPAGNIICVPQREIMRDAANYQNPLEFQGFRHLVKDESNESPVSTSRLSQPSMSFPFWGSVSRSCPGRFYASMSVKLIITHIIKNYEFKLANKDSKSSFTYYYNVIPHPHLKILLRKRRIQTSKSTEH